MGEGGGGQTKKGQKRRTLQMLGQGLNRMQLQLFGNVWAQADPNDQYQIVQKSSLEA